MVEVYYKKKPKKKKTKRKVKRKKRVTKKGRRKKIIKEINSISEKKLLTIVLGLLGKDAKRNTKLKDKKVSKMKLAKRPRGYNLGRDTGVGKRFNKTPQRAGETAEEYRKRMKIEETIFDNPLLYLLMNKNDKIDKTKLPQDKIQKAYDLIKSDNPTNKQKGITKLLNILSKLPKEESENFINTPLGKYVDSMLPKPAGEIVKEGSRKLTELEQKLQYENQQEEAKILRKREQDKYELNRREPPQFNSLTNRDKIQNFLDMNASALRNKYPDKSLLDIKTAIMGRKIKNSRNAVLNWSIDLLPFLEGEPNLTYDVKQNDINKYREKEGYNRDDNNLLKSFRKTKAREDDDDLVSQLSRREEFLKKKVDKKELFTSIDGSEVEPDVFVSEVGNVDDALSYTSKFDALNEWKREREGFREITESELGRMIDANPPTETSSIGKVGSIRSIFGDGIEFKNPK